MGLFSRKQKSPRESGILESQSTTSFGSSTFRGLTNNRASAGSMLTPNTPLSPLPSLKIPKLDLPRPPDPALDPAGYLRSLGAIRDRAKVLLEKAEDDELVHFDVDMNKFPNVVTFVSGLIKVRLFVYGEIKSLRRWRFLGLYCFSCSALHLSCKTVDCSRWFIRCSAASSHHPLICIARAKLD